MRTFLWKLCLWITILAGTTCKNSSKQPSQSTDTSKISKIQPDTSSLEKPSYVTIEEEDFSINFPTTPIRVEDTTDRDVEYSVQKGDTVNYILYYRDYKEAVIQKMGAKKFLQNQEKQVIEKMGFTQEEILENKEVDFYGYPGIALKAGSVKNTFLIYRIYLVGNRLYQLGISHTKNFPSEEEIKSFIESFQLKNIKISRS